MKKLFLFLAMASTTMFVSCGSDDSDNTTNPPAEATAITLSASATTVQVGTAVTFTVKNNLVPAVDVTSSSTFTANNVAFNGPTFTSAEAGTFTVVAKNGSLTSAAVVITVTPAPVEAEENSIFINGENFSLDNSILVFWGGYAEDPNATEATNLWWSIVSFDTESASTATNYIDLEFLGPLPTGEEIELPVSGESNFKTLYEVAVDGEAVTLDSVESGNLTFAAWPSAVNMPHSFSSAVQYNGNASMQANFDGNWLGVQDASQSRPAAPVKNFKKAAKNVKVLSRAELKAAKAKFFANLKK